MKKYEIRYDVDNVYISRRFPETRISRVILRTNNLEKDIRWAKRSILEEYRERYGGKVR